MSGQITTGRASRAAIATATRTLGELRRALALVADEPAARTLAANASTEVIIESPLADWLYAHWWAAPTGDIESNEDDSVRTAMRRVAALEESRRRAAGVSPRWLVLAGTARTVAVVPLEGSVPSSPLRPLHTTVDRVVGSSRPGTMPAPGDLVDLARGVSQWDQDHGWWWAHGADDGSVPADPLDRWYVHALGPAHAAHLMRELIPAFVESGAQYSIKCLPGAEGYGRADALVAYTPRPLTGRIAARLRQRAAMIAPHVAPAVVPTTRRILPGISCAQDPDSGDSFGQVRTAQVAALSVILGFESARRRHIE